VEPLNREIRAVEELEKALRRIGYSERDKRDFKVARMKKAVIIVKLVPENTSVSDSQIVKGIITEAKIQLGCDHREGNC
jgi:hypothetical protein